MRTIIKLLLFLFFLFQVHDMAMRAAFPEEDYKINIHGYLSQGFLFSTRNNFLLDSKKGTFHFNELGLNFTSQLTDRLHIGIQFAAHDFGDKGNDKVVIDWAFADYMWRNWLGFRLGKTKLPIGFYSKTRDIDMLRTFILLPQGVYYDSFRETAAAMKGIGIYGVVSSRAIGNFSYEVSIGTTNIDIDSSSIDFAETIGDIKISQCDMGRLFSGCLTWDTPLKGLRVGMTFFDLKLRCTGTISKDIVIPIELPPYWLTIARMGDPFITDISSYKIQVFSLEYTWNNFVLAAEYLKFREKMDVKINSINTKMGLKSESYYISGSYRFSNWYELGGYYSIYNNPPIAPPGLPYLDFQKDICASMRFDLNQHWTFKLEGHLVNGAALCLPKNNLNDAGRPVFVRRWAMFGSKFTYTF